MLELCLFLLGSFLGWYGNDLTRPDPTSKQVCEQILMNLEYDSPELECEEMIYDLGLDLHKPIGH